MGWRKAGLALAAASAIGIGAYSGRGALVQGLKSLAQNANEKSKQKLVSENQEAWASEVEARFGIRFYRRPNIAFGYPPGISEEKKQDFAQYHPKTDTLYFFPNQDVISGDSGPVDSLVKELFPGEKHPVKEDYVHESIHSYRHWLLQMHGRSSGLPESDDISSFIGTVLVREGTATLVERSIAGRKCEFNEKYWFRNEDAYIIFSGSNPEMFFSYIYNSGCKLAEPIVRRFCARGLDALFLDPPDTKEELENLPAYRQKLLDRLESENPGFSGNCS